MKLDDVHRLVDEKERSSEKQIKSLSL